MVAGVRVAVVFKGRLRSRLCLCFAFCCYCCDFLCFVDLVFFFWGGGGGGYRSHDVAVMCVHVRGHSESHFCVICLVSYLLHVRVHSGSLFNFPCVFFILFILVFVLNCFFPAKCS